MSLILFSCSDVGGEDIACVKGGGKVSLCVGIRESERWGSGDWRVSLEGTGDGVETGAVFVWPQPEAMVTETRRRGDKVILMGKRGKDMIAKLVGIDAKLVKRTEIARVGILRGEKWEQSSRR